MNITANDLQKDRSTFAFRKKFNRHHPSLVLQTNDIGKRVFHPIQADELPSTICDHIYDPETLQNRLPIK
jgi:hypothetical protein